MSRVYDLLMARKLDDPELQSEFLELIRKGKPRGKAAKAIGVSSSTVRNYCKHNPEFYDLLLDAEEDSFDPIEQTTRELAIAGDISAIKEYRTLKRRREVEENRRQVIEQHHQVQIEASSQAKELIGLLRQRKEADILELEPIE